MSRHRVLVAALVAGVSAGSTLASFACSGYVYPQTPGPTISGVVLDPLGLEPEDAVLMLGSLTPTGGEMITVRQDASGAFKTHGLAAGTYALEVIRTPSSSKAAAIPVARQFVEMAGRDITGVVVTILPDMTLQGRYRIDGCGASPPWPPRIHVQATLIYHGRRWSPTLQVTQALPEGRFALRNAYGPHVIDASYDHGPDTPWGPERVVLDGRDITNIPTDFSLHTGSSLEVVIPCTAPSPG